MVAPLNESAARELYTADGARRGVINALQQMGINPYSNYFASALLDRAGEAAMLMNAYNIPVEQANNFLRQWTNARWTSGSGGGGRDLSRQGITNFLGGFLGNTNQNDPGYHMLRTGDPDDDFNQLRSFQALRYGGDAPGIQQSRQRMLTRWYDQFRARNQQNPNQAGNVIDAFLGNPTPMAIPTAPPPPSGAYSPPPAAQPPATPPPGTTPPTTPPTTTPPGAAPPPGATPPPGTPPTGGQQFQSWNDVLSYLMQGHEQRNLSTRGMAGAGRGFTFGGVTYDPTRDTGRQYRNMSSQGRLTNRGAAWNVFVYRLQQLMRQRDMGGNPALGFGADATNDQLARMAAQFVNANNTGSTGLSF